MPHQVVADVMTRGVRTMAPDDSITLAAQAMQELDIGALPVCDGARLLGMVTDRDIVVRGVAQERWSATVRDIMSEDVLYCFEDEPVREALASMGHQQVRRLAVVDREKRLVGMLSLGDIATKAREVRAGEAIRDISEPSAPQRGGISAASGSAGGGQTA